MVSIETVRHQALSFEGAEEMPHFDTISFRVRKKIFATLDLKRNRACLKLSETEQDLFTLTDKNATYPVPNTWGKQGWTFFELDKVRKTVFRDALLSAYQHVAAHRK